MGIYKARGSPYYQYDFTVGGVRYRGSTQTDRRNEAEAIHAKRRSEAVLGNHYDLPTSLTLSQAFARYELEHGQFLKSYATVREHIDHLLNHFEHATLLEQIGQAELESYIAACRSKKYRRKYRARTHEEAREGKTLHLASNATINRRVAAFRKMHNLARTSWEVRVRNIAFNKLRLDEPEPVDRTLSVDDAQLLIDRAPERYNRMLWIG